MISFKPSLTLNFENLRNASRIPIPLTGSSQSKNRSEKKRCGGEPIYFVRRMSPMIWIEFVALPLAAWLSIHRLMSNTSRKTVNGRISVCSSGYSIALMEALHFLAGSLTTTGYDPPLKQFTRSPRAGFRNCLSSPCRFGYSPRDRLRERKADQRPFRQRPPRYVWFGFR